jgi:arabidopsis histidine kinase 2/3/4 (cytokinin receptor)
VNWDGGGRRGHGSGGAGGGGGEGCREAAVVARAAEQVGAAALGAVLRVAVDVPALAPPPELRKAEGLVSMCEERARMLQDQFAVSVNHVHALAILVATFHYEKHPPALDQVRASATHAIGFSSRPMLLC